MYFGHWLTVHIFLPKNISYFEPIPFLHYPFIFPLFPLLTPPPTLDATCFPSCVCVRRRVHAYGSRRTSSSLSFLPPICSVVVESMPGSVCTRLYRHGVSEMNALYASLSLPPATREGKGGKTTRMASHMNILSGGKRVYEIEEGLLFFDSLLSLSRDVCFEGRKEIPPRGILQERSLKSASFRVLNSSQLRAD